MNNECDWCAMPVTTDANGYWVGDDDTSDCPSNDRGHTVNGRISA